LREHKRYRKDQRLRTADITALLAAGRPVKRPGLTVLARVNAVGTPRLGLIVPKRILPRAVDRNRVKRLLREWFRGNQARLGSRDVLIRVTGKTIGLAAIAEWLANQT
jgi:ribonuclease P protein component